MYVQLCYLDQVSFNETFNISGTRWYRSYVSYFGSRYCRESGYKDVTAIFVDTGV